MSAHIANFIVIVLAVLAADYIARKLWGQA